MSALVLSAGPGRRKAAVALVALGPERAATILAGLDEDEVRGIALEIAQLGPVSREEMLGTMAELSRGMSAVTQLPAPGKRYAQDLLVRSLGAERGAAAAAELDRPAPFAWLRDSDPDAAAKALSSEPPAAVALALAHADGATAAALLVRLPADVRVAVATRVAALTTVHPDTLAQVEQELRGRVARALQNDTRPVQGPKVLADVLAKAGRDVSREVLAALAATHESLADATRAALFTFEDLCAMDAKSLQVMLRELDMRELAVALVGCDDRTVGQFTGNLSERARETLTDELDLAQTSRAADVATARTSVVAVARRLEEEGTLVLVRSGNDA